VDLIKILGTQGSRKQEAQVSCMVSCIDAIDCGDDWLVVAETVCCYTQTTASAFKPQKYRQFDKQKLLLMRAYHKTSNCVKMCWASEFRFSELARNNNLLQLYYAKGLENRKGIWERNEKT